MMNAIGENVTMAGPAVSPSALERYAGITLDV